MLNSNQQQHRRGPSGQLQAFLDQQQQQQQQSQPQSQFANARSRPGSLGQPNGGGGSGIGLKDISLSQLSALSVNQLAALQQQLSAMSQGAQQQVEGGGQTTSNFGHNPHQQAQQPGRHQRQLSANSQQLMQMQQQAPLHIQTQLYNQLSPTHAQMMQFQQHLSPLHAHMSPTGQFHPHHAHLLAPPPQQLFGFAATTPGQSFLHPSQAQHVSPTVAKGARRNSRSGTGSRLSPTPFPMVNLKLKRKLRKNNREKQRRSEINDQFEILCNMLGLGPAATGGGGNAGVGSSNASVSTGVGGASAASKVEKFTILSEACHSIERLRLELAIYKEEKRSNREELEKLQAYLDAHAKAGERCPRGLDVASRFFPNLQCADVVLPPSKAAQPKSAMLDSDEEGEEGTQAGGDGDGDKEMADDSPSTLAVVPTKPKRAAARRAGAAANTQSRSVSPINVPPTIAEKRSTRSTAQQQQPPLSGSPFGHLSSPPALPSPTNGYGGVDTSMGVPPSSSSAGVGSSVVGAFGGPGRTSPSLSALLSSGRAGPTHRPRQHSRSNSSSALPKFGSNDFGSHTALHLQQTKTSHSRQASHARSRSLQFAAQQAAGVATEADLLGGGGSGHGASGLDVKPTLEGSHHSRTNSGVLIPPQPSIPSVTRFGLHSTVGSMDLGFATGGHQANSMHGSSASSGGGGGHAGAPMMSPQGSPPVYPYYAGPARLRMGGHGRNPSELSSFLHGLDAAGVGSSLLSQSHPHGGPSASSGSSSALHTRHRSTASIGGEMLFPNVSMEDDTDINVFEQAYGQ